MTFMNKILSAASLVTLTLVLACGGGGGSTPPPPAPTAAAALAYTDPTSGTWQLKKNTTLSTATHLVLELVGPAASTGTGVAATFSADTTKVTWANVVTGDPVPLVQNGTAFALGTLPQILKGKATGNVLQAAAAQKGTSSPVALNVPVLRIALDLKASQPVGAITFTADGTNCQVIDGSGNISAISISVGTLTAQ